MVNNRSELEEVEAREYERKKHDLNTGEGLAMFNEVLRDISKSMSIPYTPKKYGRSDLDENDKQARSVVVRWQVDGKPCEKQVCVAVDCFWALHLQKALEYYEAHLERRYKESAR